MENSKENYNKIISFLKKYQEKTDVKGYVLGVSGGKDSTIVAKLLCDAIGKENVLGVLMPNGVQSDIYSSRIVCDILNIKNITLNIANTVNSIIGNISSSTATVDLISSAIINISPRVRMTYLYAIAQSLGYRVAGTGNKSEQFIGWCTKWGDMACDINPIAHLTCTEVIALGDYMELPYDLVHKAPSDGLTGKNDEDNFGFSYDELDKSLSEPIENIVSGDFHRLPEKAKQMHDNSRHKFAPITIDNYDSK